jgi:hypothetical protein
VLTAVGGTGGTGAAPESHGGSGGVGRIRIEDGTGSPTISGSVVPNPTTGPALALVQGQAAWEKPATATGWGTGAEPAEAFNGLFLPDDAWNANGGPPQAIEVDLEKPTTVARVVLFPDVAPIVGLGSQEIWVSSDGTNFTRAWSSAMDPISLWTSEVADFSASPLEDVRALRLVTTATPCCPLSWVAWTEIEVQEAASESGFGCGCPGTAGFVPRLFATGGSPSLGNAGFGLGVRRTLGGAGCALFLGTSHQHWAGAPLPFEIPGLPGCYVFAALQDTFGLATTSGSGPGEGEATFPIPIPNVPAFVGITLYFQAAVADPGAGPAGVVFTNATRLTVVP